MGGALLAVFTVLLSAVAVSTWQYVKSEQARGHAVVEQARTAQAKDEAVALAEFLTGMFEAIDPVEVGSTVSVKSMLDQAVALRADHGASRTVRGRAHLLAAGRLESHGGSVVTGLELAVRDLREAIRVDPVQRAVAAPRLERALAELKRRGR